ncbi:MAG: hypothetical protein MR890_08515 [Akkermansia muciniphila]|nr:hypothetical protein [Akkermansia muciniphila]
MCIEKAILILLTPEECKRLESAEERLSLHLRRYGVLRRARHTCATCPILRTHYLPPTRTGTCDTKLFRSCPNTESKAMLAGYKTDCCCGKR